MQDGDAASTTAMANCERGIFGGGGDSQRRSDVDVDVVVEHPVPLAGAPLSPPLILVEPLSSEEARIVDSGSSTASGEEDDDDNYSSGYGDEFDGAYDDADADLWMKELDSQLEDELDRQLDEMLNEQAKDMYDEIEREMLGLSLYNEEECVGIEDDLLGQFDDDDDNDNGSDDSGADGAIEQPHFPRGLLLLSGANHIETRLANGANVRGNVRVQGPPAPATTTRREATSSPSSSVASINAAIQDVIEKFRRSGNIANRVDESTRESPVS